MKTLLLTGFGLWGDETCNSSWEILRDNPLALPAGWQARIEQLPVSWRRGPERLDQLLEAADVRAVVCFGMCRGRTVNVERIAINLNETTRADADGRSAPGDHVIAEGPPAYWSGLPVARLVAALEKAHVPTAVSHHAGGFLCNCIFYRLMHRITAGKTVTTAGFVHVPHFETDGGVSLDSLRLAVPVIATEVMRAADDIG